MALAGTFYLSVFVACPKVGRDSDALARVCGDVSVVSVLSHFLPIIRKALSSVIFLGLFLSEGSGAKVLVF